MYYTRLIFNLWVYYLVFLIPLSFIYWDLYLTDLPFRVLLNNSIINLFNVFWTSITYLTLFALTLLFLLSQWYNNVLSLPYLTLIVFLFIYSWSLSDLLLLNSNFVTNSLITSDINLLLSNNLNKYHPYILYMSTFLLLITLTPTLTLLWNRYQIPYHLLRLSIFSDKIFFWNIIALLLGSWWALQEGTWGGWWNWDTSEVLGLIVLIISLILTHQVPRMYFFAWRLSNNLLYLYLLTLFFLLLQLNFELTSHSFGSRISYFFNNSFFLYEFSSIILLLTLFTILNILKQHVYIRLVYSVRSSPLQKPFLFYTIWSSWVLYASLLSLVTSPLINYYIWQLFELNLLNLTCNIKPLLISVSFLTIYYFIRSLGQITYILLILTLFNTYPFPSWLGLLLIPPYSAYYLLHTLIILLVQLNFLSTLFDLTLSNAIGTVLNTYSTTYGGTSYCIYYSCYSNIISLSESVFGNSQNLLYSHNFFYKSNIPRLNNFTLFFNHNGIVNSYHITNLLSLDTCYFELTSLEPLLNLLLSFLLLFIYILTPFYKRTLSSKLSSGSREVNSK
jgi:hypothetical protein